MPHPSRLLLLLLLVTAETLAAFPLVMGAGIADASSLHNALLVLLWAASLAGLGVALTTRALGIRYPLNRSVTLAAAMIAALLVALLATRSPINAVPVGLVAALYFWRGSVPTQEDQDHEAVKRRFGFGFALLLTGIALLVARGVIYRPSVWVLLSIIGIAYTVLALASLSAARVEETREGSAVESVTVAIAVELALVLIVGLAALAFFAQDISGALIGILGPAWDAIANVIATALGIAAMPLFWIGQHLHLHIPVAHHGAKGPVHPGRPLVNKKQHRGGGNAGGAVIIIVGLALLALGLAAAIWRSVPRRERKERERGFEEERKSLISPGAFWRMLMGWFRSLFNRSAGTAGGAIARVRRRVLGPVYPDDPVRRVYAQVLYRAARQGLERPATATPAEFQNHLQHRWPEGGEDFAVLTAAYMARRYGDLMADESQVRDLRERWHRVRRLMRAEVASA